MADYFDPSPRSSKRRRIVTYGGPPRTTTDAPAVDSTKKSVLRNVSSTIGSISKRLFDRKAESQQADVQDDSAYASQENNPVDENALEAEHARHPANEEEPEAIGPDERPDESAPRASESHDANTRAGRVKRQPNQAHDEASNLEIVMPKKRGNMSKRKQTSSERRVQKDLPGTGESIDDAGDHESPSKTTRRSSRSAQDAPRDDDILSDGMDADPDTIVVLPRSSGRETKRPGKFSIDHAKKRPTATPPASILTPSKRRKGQARKSVAFGDEQEQSTDDLGFRDINVSSKKKRKAMPKADKFVSPTVTGAGQSSVDRPDTLNDAPIPEPDPLDYIDILTPDLPEIDSIVQATTSHPDNNEIEDSSELSAIKSIVLSRLTSRSSPLTIPPHLTSKYTKLHALLLSTITLGESNSLLLLGSRGSGKSFLFNTAIADLVLHHADSFHTIRLNGFVQTDDKLALREIWRQLGREMDVDEDETNAVSSYADTMASLLSLLSHPEELAETFDPDADAGGKTAKSVIFLLDEFDLFTTHPRQTLLYNLFDIAQARKAPIAVIGCSTRMDVVDSLEKRVKSRFSHRWMHVPAVKSIGELDDVLKDVLCVSPTAAPEKVEANKARKRWNEYIEASPTSRYPHHQKINFQQTTFLPSSATRTAIRQIFHTTKSIPDLFTALYIPIATLGLTPGPEQPQLPLSLHPPSLLDLLPQLSTLHLSLLTASTRLATIHSLPTLNFNLVHAHYIELLSKSRLQACNSSILARGWGRDLAKSAWEDLALWGYIVGVNSGEGEREDARMYRVEIGIEDVKWAVSRQGGSAEQGLGRWCREV